MQINDTANNKNYPKQNTYNTLAPLSWILKIFALDCNTDEANNSCCAITRNIITAAILGSITICSLYFKIKYLYSNINVSIKVTDAVQMTYDYLQYIVDLYFVYKYGRHISLEYFKQYSCIDRILGVIAYCTIKRRMMKLVGFFICIWITSSTFDFAAWVLSYGWVTPLVYIVAYVYLFIKIITTLDFTAHVMLIEVRLKIIGDIVQDYYSGTDCSPLMIGDVIHNKNWLYSNAFSRISTMQSRPHSLKSLASDDHHEIKWLTRCYLMLTEQVAFINSMYGFRILLNSLSLLIDMVRFTNISVRIVIGSQQTTYDSGYFPAVSSLMRLLTCVAVFISLVNHCEQAYRQRCRIISIIDHLLINKSPSEELKEAMTELRGFAQEHPIYFNMANFFNLNYSLLMSIASVVVTYTIILLESGN